MTFKELRQKSGMNLTQFSQYFGIPYRTVQNWDRGERQCPEYLLDLMEYKLYTEYKLWAYKQKILSLPRGYRYDENEMVQIDEAEAQKVRAFFEKYIQDNKKYAPTIPKSEPIISKELFNAVQNRRKSNEKSETNVNSETPTYQTRCGKCGIELVCLDSVKEHLNTCPNCGEKINK